MDSGNIAYAEGFAQGADDVRGMWKKESGIMFGRRPKISWQKSRKEEKIRSRQLSGWLLVLYILYTAVLSVLLVYAACRMAREQIWPQLAEQSRGFIRVLGLEILVILTWNEVMYAQEKRKLRQIGSLLLLAVAILGCFWYYRESVEELRSGFYSIGQQYLAEWNRYYKISGGTTSVYAVSQQLAWELLFILLVAVLQTLSALLRRRTVMLLLPVAVLSAEMSVGLTPGWHSIACMFAAGILSLYLDCHREFQVIPALILAVLMVLILPVTGKVMAEPASQVNLFHDRLLTFQHRMEQELRDIDWQELLQDEGRVDYHSPGYSGKEVMTVAVDALPDSTLYLRGYYGTDYEKGWEAGEKEFDRACRQHGISGQEAAGLLAELCSRAYEGSTEKKLCYELEYTGLRSSYVYLPYGADLETAEEDYELTGDYAVEKRRGLKRFTVEGWCTNHLVQSDKTDGNQDAKILCTWYNEYVLEHYLDVPDGMTAVTEMVNDMERGVSCRNFLNQLESEDTILRNEARLYLANLVAGRLGEHASYNLEPGNLPRGADPVEYFLGERKEGYCTHFASAGILLLRQMGVPARYASGYVVRPSQFHKSGGSYVASVKDEAAHAWAEIWLDDLGWVPVEMTPGYDGSATVLLTQYQQSQQQEALIKETPETEKIAASQPDPEDGEEHQEDLETENDAETEKDTDTENPAASETEDLDGQNRQDGAEPPAADESDITGIGIPISGKGTETDGNGTMPEVNDLQDSREGWGFAGEGGWAIFGQNGRLKVSHVLGGILGMMLAAGLGYLILTSLVHRRQYWQKRIRACIAGGNTRKAVRAINRRFYKQLRKRRPGTVVLKSDEEYLAALKKQYPQITAEEWESYLTVVRRTAYSREKIEREEAQMCYALLKRIGYGQQSSIHRRSKNIQRRG